MKKFQPEYVPYRNRMLDGFGLSLIAILFLIIRYFFIDVNIPLATILIIAVIVLIPFIYAAFRNRKKYLKYIAISNTQIEVIIVEKDREITLLKDELENVRIRIFESFSYRFARSYTLQIDVKQNGKFQTVFEQYEIEKWNLNIFKEIFAAYCEAKNIPYSVASIKRTIFW